jgi:two-component system chemotaxis sensor kinase CheA
MRRQMDLDQLRHIFVQEAEDGLSAMEDALLALESRPEDSEPINEIFRFAHTIKGGAGMVGFESVAEYAHKVEDALSLIRDGAITVTPARITALLQIVDVLREMVAVAALGKATPVRAADLALLQQLSPDGVVVDDTPADPDVADENDTFTGGGVRRTAARSLRVDMIKLDGLLNLSGEIAVAKGRLMQSIAANGAGRNDMAAAEEMERLLTSLHEFVMTMRLVPLGPSFRQHLRTVRDIAASQGKLVRVLLEGEDVEVDASIVEQLRDPLSHLVRNAVDHGIEHPAARRDAGKDPCGTITLHARHERGLVIIEVRDDGRGMSRDRIVETAERRGVVTAGENLTDAQVFALTMAPGFSTASEVTAVSGRGVGMDVVRRNIEAVRGAIEIASPPDQGTTIRLRLPLTVAIIDGFVVGVNDERYVIPVDAVIECLTLPDDDRRRPTGVLRLRGEALPYIRLRHVLEVEGDTAPARESVVVIHSAGFQAGLVVDHLFGETQAVLKPLPSCFGDVPGVSGTTIMGDGRVALILDVSTVLEQATILSLAQPAELPS